MDNNRWTKYLKYGGGRSGGCSPKITTSQFERMFGNIPAHGAVVDVGAGSMEYSRAFRAKGFQVYAVDANMTDEDLKEAKTHDIYGMRGDMHDLPLQDAAMDFVFCNHVFEHAIAPLVVLFEFNRVLKFNAAAYIATPGHTERWVKDRASGHVNVPTKLQMEDWCELAGFKIESYEEMNENQGSSDENDVMQIWFLRKVKNNEF